MVAIRYYILVCLLSVASCALAQNIGVKTHIDAYRYQSSKDVNGSKGIVACAHPLAAKVGKDILMQGGNAMDAAIAVQLALAVVYPQAGNIGGGGFMVARMNNKNIAVDFREVAPAAATKNMYVDASGNANLDLSQEGMLSCGVPGTVAGIFAAMKYARLPFSKLIQPAIDLAEFGYAITQREADNLDSNMEYFRRNNVVTNAFTAHNGWWKAGDTLVQKDLANSLMRIRDSGAKGFYEGQTAALITAQMKTLHGIITLADLKNYKVRDRTPAEFDYKGYHIVTMPLPASGGVLLQQMLKMLAGKPLPLYGHNTTKSVQLITEVERRAYADRAEFLGDPDFSKVPVKQLVSDKYAISRMVDYDSMHASVSRNIDHGVIKESDQTTHLSIIDKDGNCVSLTTTLNGYYGSKCVVAGAGFFLNNEMDDFSIQPGVPNQYGAVGGAANAIAPGKRMLSSMTPTIVLKDGKPFMVVGTPGGTTILTSVLQSIVDVIDFGMNAHDAVNKPKFHHQWLPDRIDVEKEFPDDVCKQLQDMGYKINLRKPWSRVELIKWKAGKVYEAAADSRGDDAAEAVE